MTIAESVKFAKDVIKHWGNPTMSHLPAYTQEHVKFAEAFLKLAEPEWLDRPDSDGFWWLLLGTQFPILVFVEPGMAHYVRDTKRYRIDVGHERKYAKAIVPTPPKEEPNK